MGSVEQLLESTLDLDSEVVSYLSECLSALGTSPPTDEVAEVLAPFVDELEMSVDDAAALAEDVVATLAASDTKAGSAGAPSALQPASKPAPEPAVVEHTPEYPRLAPAASQRRTAENPFANESLPYGGDCNAAMAAQDRAAVRQILEYRDRVAAEATAKTAREERAAQLAQQQARAQEALEERRVDPADGNAYTRQDFIDAYGGTAEWDAIGSQPQGYRKPELPDEYATGTLSTKKNKNKNKQRQPEPEPELKGLSGGAKPFSMSAAAAAPAFQFSTPAANAWGPALGQPQQPQQWGGAAVPGPPAGQPPNRHHWETQAPPQQQQQQQQQQWPPQQQQQQQQQQQPGPGVAPARLDFATKLKLKQLQDAYGWVDKDQVAHAYITTGAHMGKTEQWLRQNFPKPADWAARSTAAAGAAGGPGVLPGKRLRTTIRAPLFKFFLRCFC